LPFFLIYKIKGVDIYQYIAETRPQQAAAVINQFGFELQGVNNPDDLANCLENLVAEDGEPALLALAQIHPDRELIIESLNKPTSIVPGGSNSAGSNGNCNCPNCRGGNGSGTIDRLMSGFSSAAQSLPHQGNLLIIGGILVIGLALVLKSSSSNS
jgi:hypothetical protein